MVQTGCPALNGGVPDNLPVISRPRQGAMIGGVCAGLARRWQVDPIVLRITVVVLAFFGGLGLVAYAAGMLLMPRDGRAELPVHRLLPFTQSWSRSAVIAVVVVAAVVVAGIVGSQGIGIGPLAVIFGIWFFGVRGRGHAAHRTPAPPPEPTPFERAADHWRHRLVEQQTPGYVGVAAPAPAEQRWTQPYTDPATDLAVRDDDLPVPVPSRPVRRWRMWWLALGLVGGAVLAVAALGLVLGLPTGPLAYSAAVLAGLGATLLVASRSSRPPLLLPATVVAAVVTASCLVATPAASLGAMGDEYHHYATAAELPQTIDHGVGTLTVDLSSLELDADRELTVHAGVGDVGLRVPAGVRTVVDWEVGTGEVSVLGADTGGQAASGLGVDGRAEFTPEDAGEPTLWVTVTVGVGELAVTP
jgi:phage shock protein PspC (stress-responsive transcriptional regulator)